MAQNNIDHSKEGLADAIGIDIDGLADNLTEAINSTFDPKFTSLSHTAEFIRDTFSYNELIFLATLLVQQEHEKNCPTCKLKKENH